MHNIRLLDSHHVERSICQTDIDECMSDNHGCSHLCVNTEGSAYCSCPLGYAITEHDLTTSSNKTCVDVDECADGTNFGCSHICLNLDGGAECKCPTGFKLRADQKSCKGLIRNTKSRLIRWLLFAVIPIDTLFFFLNVSPSPGRH